MTVNVKEIAAYIASNENLSKATSERIVKDTFAYITEALKNSEEVAIPDFGKFVVTDRAARTGRNPATGETIEIAASKKASFKPAKSLKDGLK